MTTQTQAPPARGTAAPATAPARASRRPLADSRLIVIATQLVLLVGFLSLWEAAARNRWVDPLFTSRPSAIWSALIDYLGSDQASTSIRATATAVLESFAIGSALGILVGLILGSSPFLDRVISPFLVPLNAVPRIALAPLFVAWFGLTNLSKVVLGVSVVFFILVENARSAVKGVDRDQLTMARVVGLRGWRMLTKVVLPSAVPTIFAGLRLGITYAILGVIGSEMIAAKDGLGQDVVRYSSELHIDFVFAVLIVLVVLATVTSWIFGLLERRLLRWQR
ncbi:ABC transporter permease [Yinghuangia sp. ASG 101]|uniref:ABC transporter permease n=1 Tax=Yinghuangia sp. ASG 101 TaxID=2896848 RepID=UPI001E626B6C|nr:ABC transporter permease [Yinghuangia sp. ASG 101]UGQ11617.1 ABC transporter permease [Yinghuangia sp. ASG 101]